MDGLLKPLSRKYASLRHLADNNTNDLQKQREFLDTDRCVAPTGCCGVEKTSFAYVKRVDDSHRGNFFGWFWQRDWRCVRSKRYPFYQQIPFPVLIDTSDYEVKGNIYLTTSQQSWQLLDNDLCSFRWLTPTLQLTMALIGRFLSRPWTKTR